MEIRILWENKKMEIKDFVCVCVFVRVCACVDQT